MNVDGTEVDAYGYPTEAARAYAQMKRQDPLARVQEQMRLRPSKPLYAIWGNKQGKAIRLSLNMPDEATAWINANYQLTPKIDKAQLAS